MNIGVFFAVTLALLFPFAGDPQTNRPTGTPRAPWRNTFVTAAETVIDNASAIDIKADDDRFNIQMGTLKVSKGNLDQMAADDREHDIVLATNDMVFAISACHIQIRNGGNDSCLAQVDRAKVRTMETLNRHKANGAWVDGPPA